MMLLVWIPHLENHQFRQLLCFTVKEVGGEVSGLSEVIGLDQGMEELKLISVLWSVGS